MDQKIIIYSKDNIFVFNFFEINISISDPIFTEEKFGGTKTEVEQAKQKNPNNFDYSITVKNLKINSIPVAVYYNTKEKCKKRLEEINMSIIEQKNEETIYVKINNDY